MDVEYSSLPEGKNIYTTVTLYDDTAGQSARVEVGCWVSNSDSRKECADEARVEAIKVLKKAISILESQDS